MRVSLRNQIELEQTTTRPHARSNFVVLRQYRHELGWRVLQRQVLGHAREERAREREKAFRRRDNGRTQGADFRGRRIIAQPVREAAGFLTPLLRELRPDQSERAGGILIVVGCLHTTDASKLLAEKSRPGLGAANGIRLELVGFH